MQNNKIHTCDMDIEDDAAADKVLCGKFYFQITCN